MKRTEFTKAKEYIHNIQGKGTKKSATKYNFKSFSVNYLTHEEFNDLANASGCSTTVDEGDIVKGLYFQDLGTAIYNFKYTSTQCDWCNSGCDTCNSCQGTCNSAQTYCCYDPPPPAQ